MTKDEAREILKKHNLWRRNQDDVNPYEMCNPKELGEAIDYVVEALAQPEPRLVSYAPDGSTCTLNIDGEEVYFNREQPAQEPVAWMYNGNLHEFDPSDWATEPVTPLYTSPQASEQEPVWDFIKPF